MDGRTGPPRRPFGERPGPRPDRGGPRFERERPARSFGARPPRDDRPPRGERPAPAPPRQLPAPSDARSLAWHVINRVFARNLDPTDVLSRALRDLPLQPLDRGLATELVYGVSRYRYALDALLPAYLRQPLAKLEPTLANLLRLGAYQLLYLDQVPPHAAVYETVGLAKHLDEGAGRFANAVLRAIQRDLEAKGEALRPPPERALPGWLWHRWARRLGEDEARAAARALVATPPLHLRANRLRITPDQLLEVLTAAGIAAEQSAVVPEGLILAERRPVESLPGFREGWWYLQDIGAMIVTRVLDPRPGERVIDVAAAPGGKTTHAAELMDNKGYVVALDRDPVRVKKIRENCERLGATIVEIRVADASKPLAITPLGDRVLADVPCSGFGVIRRQPDVLWRKNRAELSRLPGEQLEILRHAAALVKKGGVLVYSTCTTEPDENEEVVQKFLAETTSFTLESVSPWLPEAWRDKVNPTGTVQLWPHWSGTDAFYIARLRRR